MTIQLFVAILLLHLLNREEEEEEGFKWKNIINHEINVSGLHKASGLEVAVEGKSLQHQPQVYINNECVGNHILHLGIYRNCMLCPFLKSNNPVTEVVSAKLQYVITFERGYTV
jgi:hypothetical protein